MKETVKQENGCVSIILATYNRKETLSRSLQSVLKQTYKNIEIVVVDDGSTDGTDTYIQSVKDERIQYVRLPKNRGATHARNAGIERAEGSFIMVWDSDDVLEENALIEIMAVFDEDGSYDIVSAPARVITADGEVTFSRVSSGEVDLTDILCKRIPSNEKIRVARRTAFKDVRYVSHNIDFLVNVRLRENGRWYHLDRFLGTVYGDRSDSLTRQRGRRNKRHAIERTKYLSGFLSRHGATLRNHCPGRFSAYAYAVAVGNLLAGKRREAFKYARDAFRNRPYSIKYFLFVVFSLMPFSEMFFTRFYE